MVKRCLTGLALLGLVASLGAADEPLTVDVVAWFPDLSSDTRVSQAGLVGGLDYLFLNGIGVDSLSGTIPTLVFVLFQMSFACITVALVLGAIVDRMKFSAWIVFTVLWIVLIYCPIAHWVWGGGWMGAMGALDFAGGTVVHINAGVEQVGDERSHRAIGVVDHAHQCPPQAFPIWRRTCSSD